MSTPMSWPDGIYTIAVNDSTCPLMPTGGACTGARDFFLRDASNAKMHTATAISPVTLTPTPMPICAPKLKPLLAGAAIGVSEPVELEASNTVEPVELSGAGGTSAAVEEEGAEEPVEEAEKPVDDVSTPVEDAASMPVELSVAGGGPVHFVHDVYPAAIFA